MRIILAALLCAAGIASAEVYNLQWDYPANPQPVPSGFKSYCGDVTGTYASSPAGTAGATVRTMQLTTPAGSTKFCIVKAFDAYGESTPTNEVKLAVPPKPPAPTNLRATMEAP
jgi:hypothetical protein